MHLERRLHGGMGRAGIAARVPSYHILTSSSKPSDYRGKEDLQTSLALQFPGDSMRQMGGFGGNLYIYQKKNPWEKPVFPIAPQNVPIQ